MARKQRREALRERKGRMIFDNLGHMLLINNARKMNDGDWERGFNMDYERLIWLMHVDAVTGI